ncbi:MAG TPA: TetR/AcrR family transcriptional regulator [Steroidobacteraceae bacterium]|nr:TetR/AcrR family transcriptional regulator [Steroidobacteraceae bacterium]
MARVNLARRAEIGSAKRARTRAAILDAARQCYAAGPVTVDELMQAAGLAKGTFYVHFEDLASLEEELGATLIAELDGRLQPARLAVSDPLTRFATATTILLRYLAAAPARARLAAHAAVDIPGVSQAVFVRMREDLGAAQAAGCLALPSSDLAARIVSAIFLQAAQDLGLGRIDARAVPDIVRAVLRAIGCAPDDAAERAAEAVRNADNFAQQLAAAGEAYLPGG